MSFVMCECANFVFAWKNAVPFDTKISYHFVLISFYIIFLIRQCAVLCHFNGDKHFLAFLVFTHRICFSTKNRYLLLCKCIQHKIEWKKQIKRNYFNRKITEIWSTNATIKGKFLWFLLVRHKIHISWHTQIYLCISQNKTKIIKNAKQIVTWFAIMIRKNDLGEGAGGQNICIYILVTMWYRKWFLLSSLGGWGGYKSNMSS